MTVEAAGAVLWRRGPTGVEVAVVHRPRYDDWSLPKGKLHPGEGPLEAARREVAEETGQSVAPGAELGLVTYPVRAPGGGSDDKIVRYWAMEACGGTFAPDREVDELRWLPPAEASRQLSHERDREVLERFVALGLA